MRQRQVFLMPDVSQQFYISVNLSKKRKNGLAIKVEVHPATEDLEILNSEYRDSRERSVTAYTLQLTGLIFSLLILFTSFASALIQELSITLFGDPNVLAIVSVSLKILAVLIAVSTGFGIFRRYLLGENDFFDIFGSVFRKLRHTEITEDPQREDFYELNDRLKSLEEGYRNTLKKYRDELKESVEDQLAKTNIEQLYKRLKDELTDYHEYTEMVNSLKYMEDNLKNYDESNRRQLAINLGIGGVGAVSAVFVAVWLVFSPPPDTANSWAPLLKHYVPWISVTLLIQIMSLFFLRLYRDNIKTERYLRNEITNVASIRTGVFLAYRSDDPKSIKRVLEQLCSVERNRFLEKGQSTVELESAKIEADGFRAGVAAVSNQASKLNGNSKNTSKNEQPESA